MGRVNRILATLVVSLAYMGCEDTPLGPDGTTEGFTSNAGVQLKWYLDLPEGVGPFPTVVLGPGSGNVPADHRLLIRDARRLNDLGIAVVRYDKRGTGESGGEIPGVSVENSDATIPLLAGDMAAVVATALVQPDVDASRLGLMGLSQATWYMPLVAENMPEIRFIVANSGGVLSVGQQAQFEILTGYDPSKSEQVQDELEGWEGTPGFDPVPHLLTLEIPMIYLLGTKDPLTPSRLNADRIRELADQGTPIEVWLYESTEHGLGDVDFWADVGPWLTTAIL